MNSPLLQVRGISKSYEGAALLREVSCEVAAGEIVCLLGPSGTGKTTLLRIIAGLEEYEAGEVLLEGNDLRGVPVHRRGFGLMFQDLALFPHRNVFDNVAFGLRMMTPPPAPPVVAQRVNETLELVGLDAARFAKRDVNRLSGGEQQRVALARTLAPRPRLVMFDEPLGALDRILRDQLVDELRGLLKRLEITALYVTHDQDEAFEIADRLVILHAAQVQQSGAPVEIYRQPANVFVARFLGLTNLVEIEKFEIQNSKFKIQTRVGRFALHDARVEKDFRFLLLRPRAVKRIGNVAEARENVLRGRVVETLVRAGHQRIVIETAGGLMNFEWDEPVRVGAEVSLELKADQISVLSR